MIPFTQKHIDIIRAFCIKANPLKQKDITEVHEVGGWDEEYVIRLADVLLAIGKKYKEKYPKSTNKIDDEVLCAIIELWDMSQDFDHQSPECLAFVAELLG